MFMPLIPDAPIRRICQLAGASLTALLLVSAASAQSLLLEEDFENDANGWSAAGQSGGQAVWDGTRGSPQPGSLRVIAPPGATSGGSFKAAGQCRAVQQSQAYTVSSRVLPSLEDRNGTCFGVAVFFDEPACQGEGSIGGTGDTVTNNVWQTQFRSQTSFATSESMRVELVMSLDPGSAEVSCNFDAVRLYLGPLPDPIPVFSWSGLLMLIGALGMPILLGRKRFG